MFRLSVLFDMASICGGTALVVLHPMLHNAIQKAREHPKYLSSLFMIHFSHATPSMLPFSFRDVCSDRTWSYVWLRTKNSRPRWPRLHNRCALVENRMLACRRRLHTLLHDLRKIIPMAVHPISGTLRFPITSCTSASPAITLSISL